MFFQSVAEVVKNYTGHMMQLTEIGKSLSDQLGEAAQPNPISTEVARLQIRYRILLLEIDQLISATRLRCPLMPDVGELEKSLKASETAILAAEQLQDVETAMHDLNGKFLDVQATELAGERLSDAEKNRCQQLASIWANLKQLGRQKYARMKILPDELETQMLVLNSLLSRAETALRKPIVADTTELLSDSNELEDLCMEIVSALGNLRDMPASENAQDLIENSHEILRKLWLRGRLLLYIRQFLSAYLVNLAQLKAELERIQEESDKLWDTPYSIGRLRFGLDQCDNQLATLKRCKDAHQAVGALLRPLESAVDGRSFEDLHDDFVAFGRDLKKMEVIVGETNERLNSLLQSVLGVRDGLVQIRDWLALFRLKFDDQLPDNLLELRRLKEDFEVNFAIFQYFNDFMENLLNFRMSSFSLKMS